MVDVAKVVGKVVKVVKVTKVIVHNLRAKAQAKLAKRSVRHPPGLVVVAFNILHTHLADEDFADDPDAVAEAANAVDAYSPTMRAHQRLKEALEASTIKLRPLDLFKAIDMDHNMQVEVAELEKGLHRLGLAAELGHGEVASLVESFDADHDGLVDFSEWKESLQ